MCLPDLPELSRLSLLEPATGQRHLEPRTQPAISETSKLLWHMADNGVLVDSQEITPNESPLDLYTHDSHLNVKLSSSFFQLEQMVKQACHLSDIRDLTSLPKRHLQKNAMYITQHSLSRTNSISIGYSIASPTPRYLTRCNRLRTTET